MRDFFYVKTFFGTPFEYRHICQKIRNMKKLLFTVILTAACQFTFASTSFGHERGGYRYHEHGYYRPHCFAPIIMAPRPCIRFYTPRIWIGGLWIIDQWGRDVWVPAHWSY